MKAKYKRGKKIQSIADFENSKATYFRVLFGNKEKTLHHAFLESWQYHTLNLFIRNGWVFEADPIKEEKDG